MSTSCHQMLLDHYKLTHPILVRSLYITPANLTALVAQLDPFDGGEKPLPHHSPDNTSSCTQCLRQLASQLGTRSQWCRGDGYCPRSVQVCFSHLPHWHPHRQCPCIITAQTPLLPALSTSQQITTAPRTRRGRLTSLSRARHHNPPHPPSIPPSSSPTFPATSLSGGATATPVIRPSVQEPLFTERTSSPPADTHAVAQAVARQAALNYCPAQQGTVNAAEISVTSPLPTVLSQQKDVPNTAPPPRNPVNATIITQISSDAEL
jgi:hypothetical protein